MNNLPQELIGQCSVSDILCYWSVSEQKAGLELICRDRKNKLSLGLVPHEVKWIRSIETWYDALKKKVYFLVFPDNATFAYCGFAEIKEKSLQYRVINFGADGVFRVKSKPNEIRIFDHYEGQSELGHYDLDTFTSNGPVAKWKNRSEHYREIILAYYDDSNYIYMEDNIGPEEDLVVTAIIMGKKRKLSEEIESDLINTRQDHLFYVSPSLLYYFYYESIIQIKLFPGISRTRIIPTCNDRVKGHDLKNVGQIELKIKYFDQARQRVYFQTPYYFDLRKARIFPSATSGYQWYLRGKKMRYKYENSGYKYDTIKTLRSEYRYDLGNLTPDAQELIDLLYDECRNGEISLQYSKDSDYADIFGIPLVLSGNYFLGKARVQEKLMELLPSNLEAIVLEYL